MSSFKKFDLSRTVYRSQTGLSSSILHSSDQDQEGEEPQDLSTSILMSSDQDPDDTKSNYLSVRDPDPNKPHDLSALILQSSETESTDSDTSDFDQIASDLLEDVAISNTDHCDACQNKAESKVLEAVWYCQECKQLLCQECKSCHGAFRITKDHILVSLQPPCEPCKKKTDVAAAFYCNNCQEFLCADCKSSHETFKLLKNHEIITSGEKIKAQQKIKIEESTSGTTKNGTERRKFSDSIQLEKSHSQSASKTTNHDKTQEQQKTEDKPHFQTKNINADNGQVKTEITSTKSEMVQTGHAEDSGHNSKLQSTEEKTPKSLLEKLWGIWPSKKETEPTKVPFPQHTAKLVTEFDVTVSGDTQTPNIKGSAFLPDSRLLLVDWGNKKLKLFDANYKFVTDKQFSGEPWEVSVFDSSEVAITVRGRGIVRLSVDGDVIKEKEEISPGFHCWGVSYVSRNKLIATGRDWGRGDGILVVYTIASKQLSRLGQGQEKIGFNVTVDRGNSRAYVSTAFAATVSATDLDTNKIVFTYKHKNLSGPRGVTVDKDHNLYVCGKASQNIHQVSPAGEHIKILLSHEDGLYEPQTMSFTPSGDTFIVGSYNSKTVQVFT